MSKLVQRGSNYFVRYFVPAEFQDLIGKKEVWKTTGTSSLRDAQRLQHEIIVGIQRELTQMGRDFESDPRSPKWVKNRTLDLLASVDSGSVDEDIASSLFHEIVEEHLKARKIPLDGVSLDDARRLKGPCRPTVLSLLSKKKPCADWQPTAPSGSTRSAQGATRFRWKRRGQ